MVLAALSTAACGSPVAAPDTPANANTAQTQPETRMTPDWTRDGCAAPENFPDFVGKAEAALASLGKPAREERFALGAETNEFRIELQNLYPLPANAALPVIERTWTHQGCNLTIWLVEKQGGWTSVRALRWPEGVEF
jgi:hypothetical protein